MSERSRNTAQSSKKSVKIVGLIPGFVFGDDKLRPRADVANFSKQYGKVEQRYEYAGSSSDEELAEKVSARGRSLSSFSTVPAGKSDNKDPLLFRQRWFQSVQAVSLLP